jgi:hypothetical protein
MNMVRLTHLRPLGVALALVALTALAGLVARSDTVRAAGTFNPTGSIAVVDSTPGANSDINSEFHLPIGDYQFGGTVNFAPLGVEVTPGADVPDGAIVAHVSSVATLGLIGGGCNSSLGVEFDMMDATLDMTNTIPFDDPQEVAEDYTDTNDNGIFDPGEPFDDEDGNTEWTKANPGGDVDGDLDDQFDDEGPTGLPLGVTMYPDYLTRIFRDPDGNTLTPIARLYSQTIVAGIDVSLNFMIFEPGLLFLTPNDEIVTANPLMGFPSVTVLQAIGDPETEPNTEDSGAISDFCSPLDVTTDIYAISQDNPDTSADEGGVVLRTNPEAGVYNFVTFAGSQRDADGDGIENGLDPCPLDADTNWDPRATVPADTMPGDNDADGLPDTCDPDSNDRGQSSGGLWDHDGDGYGNRSDNCPLVANGKGQLFGLGPDNQEDTDSDGIGDQCDPDPTDNDAQGVPIEFCIITPVEIGGGGDPPPDPTLMTPCDPNANFDQDDCSLLDEDEMVIYGTDPNKTDTDDDGVSDCDEIAAGTDPLVAGADATPVPGTTPTAGTGGTGGTGGVGGDVSTGIGSLAPVASSIPAWATALSALGGAGLLGSLGALAARIFGVRLPGRRH